MSSETPPPDAAPAAPSPARRRSRRRRQKRRVRIGIQLAVGAAAIWFITHPAKRSLLPAREVTTDSAASTMQQLDSATTGADTAAIPSPFSALPSTKIPSSLIPKGRLFRSIEERARAGERIAVSVTAYCLQGRTRRGNLVRDGIIAVDRKLFPLGRAVDLFFGRSKFGRFLADDTGGVIVGGRIDVWMSDCNAARRFGRRRGYAQLVPRSP